jgi:mannose-6-phosphate isomerase-like protein (cupin superfamily)
MNRKLNLQTAEHYTWGDNCDGWHLVKSPSLSVIRERMPGGSAEKRHYHSRAQQLFYILSGTAQFEVAGEIFLLNDGESLHIMPREKHRIMNKGEADLHFLVISEPHSDGDRIEI